MTPITTTTTLTSTSPSFLSNLGTATIKVGVATTTNIAATSIITKQSATEVINNQGGLDKVLLNTTLQAIGEAAAKGIGGLSHSTLDSNGNLVAPEINKATQLTLHATLGCGIGAGMSGGGSGCLSGAAAGVIGELTAEGATKAGFDRNQAIQLSGLAGGLSAIVTGAITNQSDEEMAKNIFAGSAIGSNAAANNALQIMAQKVPPLNKSHLTIVHTPELEEQLQYVGRGDYIKDEKTGLFYKTWGAGPDGLIVGNLVSDINRFRDINLSIKVYQSPSLVPIGQEQYYTNLFDQLDSSYKDNLKYDFFPNLSNPIGYNSNSYVSGLLNAAGIVRPEIDLRLPGYNKPIPVENFGVRP